MIARQVQRHDQFFPRLLDKPGAAGMLLRYRQVMVQPNVICGSDMLNVRGKVPPTPKLVSALQ
ncbi:hypothetical protein WCLP8_5420004 [uncultured Gammaproteobacteria bacterium]